MKNENGFTLIEIIISLVMVGLMVSIVGILMVAGVKEYVFSKENVVISQKASMALKRLEKEIRGLTAIDAENSDDICVRYKLDAVSPYFRAIGIRGNAVELKTLPDADCDCSTTGDILINQVSGFSLSYEDSSVSPSTVSSTPPVKLSDLSEIRVLFTLDLLLSEKGNKTFELYVNPRNNGNLNGPGIRM
ncbi:MAG: type II secretion system protein [Pseudomonadota bacterium]